MSRRTWTKKSFLIKVEMSRRRPFQTAAGHTLMETIGKSVIWMNEIERYGVNEEWAHSGIIRAGDFCFLNYCTRNVTGTIEEQVNAAFDEMEERLALVGLTLENVVQMDCLFKNIWDIPAMERVVKERFHGKYPVRKSIQTAFANRETQLFQVDGVAYAPTGSADA